MEIGAKLKEAREAKDLSLERLQETTKIQKRYLEAIEQGNLHILPGKFYARAFIKEYAIAVGLDPNELLEEYKEEVPQPEEDSTQYTTITRSRKDNAPSKNSAVFSLIPTVIVVLLIIGIIFAAWFFYQKAASEDGNKEPEDPQKDNEVIIDQKGNEGSDETSADDAADGQNNEDKAKQDADKDSGKENGEMQSADKEAEKQPALTVTEKGTGSRPESTLKLENPSEDIKLQMKPTGKVWFDVQNGSGKSLYTDTLTANDDPVELGLSKGDRVYFNIGSAPNLEITIDGVPVEYPADPEKFVAQYLWINIGDTSKQSNE